MKTVDFSETIAASDLKVGRSSHLIEYMEVQLKSLYVSIEGQDHFFLDLGPKSCTYKNSNQIFSETTLPI